MIKLWKSLKSFSQIARILFQRPKNIPANWKILILKEDLGLLYFNPEDNQEFVKVMQPRFEYEDEIYHEVYVVYHNRSKLIAKYFKDKLFFNQQDSEHMDILKKLINQQQKLINQQQIDKLAGEYFENFWFSLDDLKFIRKFLGFKEINESIINHIRSVTCQCHEWTLSKTQGGMLYRHKEHHYYSTRIAYHSDEPAPFVQVKGTRGYYTSTGKVSTREKTDVHLEIGHVLRNPLDWYVTPCKKFIN